MHTERNLTQFGTPPSRGASVFRARAATESDAVRTRTAETTHPDQADFALAESRLQRARNALEESLLNRNAAQDRENLVVTLIEAEDELIAIPAPDARSLALKLETAWGDGGDPDDSRRGAILNDARRLAAN